MTADPGAQDGYAAALSELETILEELEEDSADVDLLTARVKRAAELIRLCRERIDIAQVEITRIVAELDEPAAPGESPDEPASEPDPTEDPTG